MLIIAFMVCKGDEIYESESSAALTPFIPYSDD